MFDFYCKMPKLQITQDFSEFPPGKVLQHRPLIGAAKYFRSKLRNQQTSPILEDHMSLQIYIISMEIFLSIFKGMIGDRFFPFFSLVLNSLQRKLVTHVALT